MKPIPLILLDRHRSCRDGSARSTTLTSASAGAATRAAAPRLPTPSARATPPGLSTAATRASTTRSRAPGLPTSTGGAARKARCGVVYSLPVRSSQAVDPNQHAQSNHSDQQRIFNDIIAGLFSPQTL